MMDKRKRTFIGLTLIFLFGGVTVLVIALSSDHWVKVVPRFDLGNNTSDKRNRSGLITYGLFRGKKILNFGTGDRPDEIFVRLDIKSMHLMNYKLWIADVVVLSMAIAWGLLTIGFTFYNLFGKPIETLTGPFGLYVWNICALVCSLLAVILFVITFYTSINNADIFFDNDYKAGWRSKNLASLDWSFYISIGAIGCFIINIVLLVLSNEKNRAPTYSASAPHKPVDGILMY